MKAPNKILTKIVANALIVYYKNTIRVSRAKNPRNFSRVFYCSLCTESKQMQLIAKNKILISLLRISHINYYGKLSGLVFMGKELKIVCMLHFNVKYKT